MTALLRSPLAMMDAMQSAPAALLPSRFWQHLNARNLSQLERDGYDNFKRSIILNYFTSVPDRRGDYQLAFLRRHLPKHVWLSALARTLVTPRHANLSWKQSRTFTLLTYLVWEYAARVDTTGLMVRLAEPLVGNPARITRNGQLISQDMANSVLETQVLLQTGAVGSGVRTVMEAGAGYGRTAWTLMHAVPHLRYVIVDIPPALYLSQRYLTAAFPDRGVFLARRFDHYDAVREAFESSSLAFLLPHQLPMLPSSCVDTFINISSFHEMRFEQIAWYFDQIERLTAGFFYTKQWQVSRNAYDGIVVREEDYPVRSRWRCLLRRPCRIHTPFFEAVYAL